MKTQFPINYSQSLISIISPIVLIIIYCFIFRNISLKKNKAKLFTSIYFCCSVVISFMVLTLYPFFSFSHIGNLLFTLMVHLYFIMLTLPVLEYTYKLATCNDKAKYKASFSPSVDPSKIGRYDNINKAKIVGAISRYSYFTSAFFLIGGGIYLFISKIVGFKSPGVYAFAPVALPALIFFFSYSFLRMLVKCPNCNLDIFFIDVNKYAYYNVAKRILKDNVMECWHCHAAYALDPAMDLDKLREENIKNWEDRADIVKSLEQDRKSSLKYI